MQDILDLLFRRNRWLSLVFSEAYDLNRKGCSRYKDAVTIQPVYYQAFNDWGVELVMQSMNTNYVEQEKLLEEKGREF